MKAYTPARVVGTLCHYDSIKCITALFTVQFLLTQRVDLGCEGIS